LEPHHPAFWRAISNAFKRFRELPVADQAIFSANRRTKANVIWSYITYEAGLELAQSAGVILRTQFESATYEITQGQIESRIKKVNSQGFSRNYPTRRALSFHSVGQYEIFPEMWSAPIHVDIGYVPNELGLDVDQVLVVLRQGSEIIWSYEIDPPTAAAVVLPLPVPGKPPKPTRVVAKRKPKKSRGNSA
jgi:hypothetical protein